MGRWRWMLREFLRARSPSPAPRGLAEPARRRHSRPSPSRSSSSSWLRMNCPARVQALRTATIPRRDPTARKERARNNMDCKMVDTTVSSQQDLQDPKPLAIPRHHTTLLDRQQEASWEEAHFLTQERLDHLLRCPGELLKDIEEGAAGPQDSSTVVGAQKHLEWHHTQRASRLKSSE
ncbi:uncharacterized protein LOC124969291 isoform X1 [Sciurus carolinensis]|uniref:uncharacterized protein LOC124969291 isoform X1 n=1 Tax=Sciurus carolinensis TaxID=30640 RepID=UPI001FB4B5E8|nr:uncharacterized protein LOC124969291 isoform X1 [Sciurus carolinensis]